MIQKERWWQYSSSEICKKFETDSTKGLSIVRAKERLERFGLNQLPEPKRISVWVIFARQFASVIVWVLLAVLVLSGFWGEWVDAAFIGLIIILNAVIGFVQEYNAEQTLDELRKLTKPTSRVIREGVLKVVPSNYLVPGDLLVLESGDIVPADGRIIKQTRFFTQEASLTGESVPVSKIDDVLLDDEIVLADRSNMAFMGTVVVRGKGQVLVTETGQKTELGKIATMLQVVEEEKTPLQVQLERLGYKLVAMCLGIVAIVFALGVFRGHPIFFAVLTALSLAVAAIPEGLPAVTTIALALGVRKMAKRNALVRRLHSVETLGCTSVICTDKTGTLTKNEMVVEKVWVANKLVSARGVGYAPRGTFECDDKSLYPPDFPELLWVLKIGVWCNGATLQQVNGRWEVVGDPTEGALLTLAGKAGLEKHVLEVDAPLVDEIPFDSERKRMSMVRDTPSGRILFVKGAADILLKRSTTFYLKGKQVSFSGEDKQRIVQAHDQLARQAYRVLALAYRYVGKDEVIDETLEQDLTFVGMVAMMDPPRPEVKAAVQTCRDAGIRTVMVTGDHKETAIAIAKKLNLLEDGFKAVDGTELEHMSDDDLKKEIYNISVYARVSVEHKMRIVGAWRQAGEVVAMTGDGVNDAPAIKAADIGVAMGITGTEVTKEASDMVITDDNFASIVRAVREGRGIYDNITKFVNYLLSSNIAELLIIFVAMLIGFTDLQGNPYIPLLPIHLLWINLVTDGLPAIALGVDPVDPTAMHRKPRDPKAPILSFSLSLRIALISILIVFSALGVGYFGLLTSPELGRTMTLTMLIMLELVRVQMVRAEYRMKLFSNLWLVGALASSFVLNIIVVYVPFFQSIFKTVSLGLTEWLIIFVATVICWFVGMLIQYVVSMREREIL